MSSSSEHPRSSDPPNSTNLARPSSSLSLLSSKPDPDRSSAKMGRLNNPVLNPFYRDDITERPDKLALTDQDNNLRVSSENRDSTNDHTTKTGTIVNADAVSDGDDDHNGYQEGIKKAEAIAEAWGKPALVGTYICIYLIFFFISLQSQTGNALLPYVYSSFALHSLVNISAIMSSIIGGVLKLPTSKLIDLWGRPQGFMLMMGFMILGIVLMACTENVETYCAGQIFYWLGNDGVQYVLDVMISDTSSLRNRGLMLSFSTTPYIATVFAGPALAQRFLDGPGFAWGYGAFAIIFPAISLPLAYLLWSNQRKAEQAGLYIKPQRERSYAELIKFYMVEFDAGGMLILIAGFVMFLLPFSLAGYETDGWSDSTIIGLLVAGFVLLVSFPFYELYVAPKSFVPWRLLTDRTLMGSCIMIAALFVSFYCWDAYFSSFLQVVYGLSVADAGYVANIYDIGSCFFGVVIGIAISYSGRYKVYALCAVPLHMLGAGLMIHFRQPSQGLGYIIMCQIFISVAGGALVICNQVAAMSANHHSDIAVILALISLSSSVGGAIGSAVSGAIWTNTFGPNLIKLLPESELANATTITGSLVVQLSYPVGSPARDAIVEAYGIAQWRMCIASVSITILTLIGVWMWRDIRIDNKKQVKGTVV